MRGRKKGFTLIEAVITIGIMGIVFGLVALGVSQLGALQDSASSQVATETKLKRTNELLSEYVSYVSLNNEDISFEKVAAEGYLISFRGTQGSSSAVFSLDFNSESHVLKVTPHSPVNEPTGYLAKNDWISSDYLHSVSLSFNDSLGLLTIDVSPDERTTRRYAYVLRV